MTKKDLLKMIDKSTLKVDSEKASVYERYYPQIKAILSSVEDNVAINDLSSLDEFVDADDFENYIKEHDVDELEMRFAQMCAQLEVWIKYCGVGRRIADKYETVGKKIVDTYKAVSDKKHKRYLVLGIITVLFAAAAATFAILEIFEVVDFGGEIASVCGVIDFFNGLVFFVYERNEDLRSELLSKEAGSSISEGRVTEEFERYSQKNILIGVVNKYYDYKRMRL